MPTNTHKPRPMLLISSLLTAIQRSDLRINSEVNYLEISAYRSLWLLSPFESTLSFFFSPIRKYSGECQRVLGEAVNDLVPNRITLFSFGAVIANSLSSATNTHVQTSKVSTTFAAVHISVYKTGVTSASIGAQF